MKYIVTINNKNYEVEVEKGQASIVKTTEAATQSIPVAAATNVVSTAVAAPSAASLPIVPAAVTAAGELVRCPMPGTIVNVKVNVGDKIKIGDTLLILEAMKMENEIAAPINGVVAQIFAVKGSSVSTGDTLVVIE